MINALDWGLFSRDYVVNKSFVLKMLANTCNRNVLINDLSFLSGDMCFQQFCLNFTFTYIAIYYFFPVTRYIPSMSRKLKCQMQLHCK
jgi:hypothetical protein